MRKIIIFLVLAGFGIWSIAQANPLDARVLQDHGSSIMLEFQLNDYTIEPIQINGNAYSKVLIQGQPTLLEKGMPELPVFVSSIITLQRATYIETSIPLISPTLLRNSTKPIHGGQKKLLNSIDHLSSGITVVYPYASIHSNLTRLPKN
jgi:hypothetical protein